MHALDVTVLLAAVYTAVLATEFVLMAVCGRREPALVPRVPELIRAAIGEIKASVLTFLWRQPFLAQRWPDTAATGHGGQRGVLLVHGYFCNRGFWNRWLQHLTARRTPFIAITLEPAFDSISANAHQIDAAVVALTDITGLAPVVVAHSMGGLAVRFWWTERHHAEPGDHSANRLHHLITIGTPHHGTWLARLAFTTNAQQMRLHSEWVQELAAREPTLHRARTTCYYSPADNIVFPAAAATLAGARNICMHPVGHVAMAACPEPLAELQRLLDETRAD